MMEVLFMEYITRIEDRLMIYLLAQALFTENIYMYHKPIDFHCKFQEFPLILTPDSKLPTPYIALKCFYPDLEVQEEAF